MSDPSNAAIAAAFDELGDGGVGRIGHRAD